MIHPLIAYALLTLGLGSSLWLFVTLKREMQIQARQQHRRIEEMDASLKEAQHIAQQAQPEVPAAHPVRSGFNLQHRLQAVRMLRRGEDLAHIAAVLGATEREVELLIRVHNLSSIAAQAAAAGRSAASGTIEADVLQD